MEYKKQVVVNIKDYLALASRAPYAWAVYIAVGEVAMFFGNGPIQSAIEFFAGGYFIVQLIANLFRMSVEKPRFNGKNLDKCYFICGLSCLVVWYIEKVIYPN